MRGFDAFAAGRFDDGGSNLYVNANGEIERIHRTDLTGDGLPDIVVPNTHGSLDRGPTRIFRLAPGTSPGPDAAWDWTDLPNESGWLSRAVDLDGDGYLDLIVVNGENGVTSELASYVYWGGPGGLTGERTELPTTGAYDVVVADLDGDGRLDLLLTSAWTDHHNEGRPRPLQAYLQRDWRRFVDGTRRGRADAASRPSRSRLGDVLGRGTQDLVVANLRTAYLPDTDSFVYPGRRGAARGRLRARARPAADARRLAGPARRPRRRRPARDPVRRRRPGAHLLERPRRRVPGSLHDDRRARPADPVPGRRDLDRGRRCRRRRPPRAARRGRDRHPVPARRRAGDRRVVAARCRSWPALHAADLDGDGRPELVASVHEDETSYDVESLVFWNGGGAEPYSPDRVSRLPVNGAMGVTSADLDGDGRPELILNGTVSGPTSRWKEFPVFVYPGSAGDPRDFDPARRLDLHSGGETYAYAIADLDLDGHADLVLARIYGVRIFPGGPTACAPTDWYELPITTGYCMQVHVADLNRDGWLDLVALVQTYDDRAETRADSTRDLLGRPGRLLASSARPSCRRPRTARATSPTSTATGSSTSRWLERDGTLAIMFGGPDGLPSAARRAGLAGHQRVGAAPRRGRPRRRRLARPRGRASRATTRARGRRCVILWGGPDGYDLAALDALRRRLSRPASRRLRASAATRR